MTHSAAEARGARRVVLVELSEDNSVGGSHRCIVDIANTLEGGGRFTPVVVFHQDNEFVAELRSSGVEVHVLPSRRLTAAMEPSFLRRQLVKVGVLRQRVSFLRSVRADIVHINNSPFGGFDDWLPAARIVGIPCITHARGFPWDGAGLFAERLCKYFDRVIAISRSIEAAWEKAGVPRRKITLIYDGVDGDAVRNRIRRNAAAVRADLQLTDDQILIVMVGHIRSWKGQDVLLQAVGQLSPAEQLRCRIVFVGGRTASEGAEYELRLKALVEQLELSDRVDFLGARRDAEDYIGAADIIVHASTSPEPFGLVVVEGMALSRAVIASMLGGPGETVVPGSGLLFDPNIPASLTTHLSTLMRDSALREALGRGGLQRSRDFALETNVAAIESVYSELLAASRGAR